MSITPEMIQEKRFSTKFKGYNMDEVDDFLDYIMDEVDKLIHEKNNAVAASEEKSQDSEATMRLESELTAAKARIAAMEAEPKTIPAETEEELKALRDEVANANEHINDLNDQLAHARAEATSARLAASSNPASEELIVLKNQLIQKDDELASKDAIIVNQEKRLEDLQTKGESATLVAVEKSEVMVQDALTRCDYMIKDAETQTRKAIAAMRVQMEEATKEYDDLRVQIREVRSRYLVTLQNQMKAVEDDYAAMN